ncbi:MAG: SDR family oxidoreductase [Chloroflexota bacterium]
MSNRVALITGGSRGIGRAIALELASLGADVVINYARKETAAESVVQAIEQMGRQAIAVKANLAEAPKTEAMLDRVLDQFGRCDIFVGNAASGIPRPILELNDRHWDWTMDINARSILRCVKRLAPPMVQQGWGRIVNISSHGSTRVLPHYGITGLSKAVIESLTRYLAVDLAPNGIITNAICPGIVDTEALTKFPIDVQETLSQAADRTPAGRNTTPEEVAKLAAFLCSDGAAMIVGQTIMMDGGMSLVW